MKSFALCQFLCKFALPLHPLGSLRILRMTIQITVGGRNIMFRPEHRADADAWEQSQEAGIAYRVSARSHRFLQSLLANSCKCKIGFRCPLATTKDRRRRESATGISDIRQKCLHPVMVVFRGPSTRYWLGHLKQPYQAQAGIEQIRVKRADGNGLYAAVILAMHQTCLNHRRGPHGGIEDKAQS
jgi:hypothetical protein